MNNRRAIILFVRDEREEATLKPLPASARAYGYGAVNRRTVSRLAPALRRGIDLVVATTSNNAAVAEASVIVQHGATFGERITNAITDTHALGYDEVVVVGNDCPTMMADDLMAAFARLIHGASIVAAPARDGGAFLVGARSGFDAATFAALPWQTAGLFAAFAQLRGAATLSIVRDDFDSWNDRRAQRALARLLGICSSLPLLLPSSLPFPSRATVKACTRIFLTAPPAC